MNRIVYLNGAFLPEAEAKISIFDRGFLMADSIYEAGGPPAPPGPHEALPRRNWPGQSL